MPLLRKLRLFQCGIRRLEISAGILPVGIEEKIIDAAVNIVMMSGIPLGPESRIELPPTAEPDAHFIQRFQPERPRRCRNILHQKRNQIIDIAAFDHEAAIHIGFTQFQLRVESKTIGDAVILQPDGNRLTAAIALVGYVPGLAAHCEIAGNDNFTQQIVKRGLRCHCLPAFSPKLKAPDYLGRAVL